MKDFVNVDKVIKIIESRFCKDCNHDSLKKCLVCPISGTIKEIANAKNPNAMEVTKCKDCKWYISGLRYCGNPFGLSFDGLLKVNPTQFCSNSKRRDT